MSRRGRSGQGAGQRHLRVGEALRHALAELFVRGEFRDPGLEGVSITVSEVRVSPDLRSAICYVLPLGGADVDRVMAALMRSAPYLRAQVAHAVQLRYMPALTFAIDRSFEEAERIDALLREARGEGREGDDPGGEEPTNDVA